MVAVCRAHKPRGEFSFSGS